MKRVVITGFGIVSSIGNDEKNVLNSLIKGKSGIIFSKEMKKNRLQSNIWGKVSIDCNAINKKYFKYMNEATAYAYYSMNEAILNANLFDHEYKNNSRVGIIIGSGSGFLKSYNNDVKKKKILMEL